MSKQDAGVRRGPIDALVAGIRAAKFAPDEPPNPNGTQA